MNRRILIWMHAVVAIVAATVAAAQQPFHLDESFHTFINTANSVWVGDILLLPDGNIYISGTFRFPGDLNDRYFARLHADGSRDLSYSVPNLGGGGRIIPWEDRYYVGGGNLVARFMPDGTWDDTFHIEWGGGVNDPYTIHYLDAGEYAVEPDGSVLQSGYWGLEDSTQDYEGQYGLIWFTNEGYLDTTKVHRHADGPIFFLSPQPDGKFLCSGYVSNFEGATIPGPLFRVEADGALDSSFLQTPQGLGLCFTFQTLTDGKVLAGGQFSLDGVGDTLSLVRFLPDGAVDPGFHIPHFEYYDSLLMHLTLPGVDDILPLGSDRYVITGEFDRVDGQTRGGIALIDTAGNLLDDYFTGNGCGGYFYQPNTALPPFSYVRNINGITPASDGSYYIYGAYHGYDDGTTNDTDQRFVSRLYGMNVGIHEQGAEVAEPLQIAPNPSAGETVLSMDTPVRKGTLTIHDASGRTVLQAAWPEASNSYTLEAGALAPGTYLVRVASSASATALVSTGKLIILP